MSGNSLRQKMRSQAITQFLIFSRASTSLHLLPYPSTFCFAPQSKPRITYVTRMHKCILCIYIYTPLLPVCACVHVHICIHDIYIYIYMYIYIYIIHIIYIYIYILYIYICVCSMYIYLCLIIRKSQ